MWLGWGCDNFKNTFWDHIFQLTTIKATFVFATSIFSYPLTGISLCIRRFPHSFLVVKEGVKNAQRGGPQRGCCIRSSLATKLLHVVLFLFHEDNSQRELKKIALGLHVIEAYTEFQQCPCISFEDMNILLRAIFIFHGLILLLVRETSEQYRYHVITKFFRI